MVKSYFDKHLNQLIRNLENTVNPTIGLSAMPDDIPSILRNRNLVNNGVADNRFVVIPFITDTHYAQSTPTKTTRDGLSTTSADSLASLEHMNNVVEFAKRFNVDAIVHGGDVIDGKATVASTKSDLKKAVRVLRSAVNQEGKKVPVMIAKGNHDNNALFGRSQAGAAKDDMKYTIKGGILDKLLKEGSSSTPKVVYDEPYKNDTKFTTNFEGYLDMEEYRVLSKLLLENGRMSARNTTNKGGNLDTLDKILTSVTMTSAEKTAYNKLAGAKVDGRTLGKGTVLTSTQITTIRNLFFRAAKLRTRGSYCYMDIDRGTKGVRVIVLDAYDVPDTNLFEDTRNGSVKYPNRSRFPVPDYGSFGKKQVEWFANQALKTTREVVIFCHHAITGTPFTTDGGSKTYNNGGDTYWIGNIELIKRILDDFTKGSKSLHTTYSAIEYYSTGENTVSLVKDDVDKVKTPLYFYNSRTESGTSWKYDISNTEWVKASVQTDFTAQGPGTVITICNGHSHSDDMRRDITNKYISLRVNASTRSGSAFPANVGFDTVNFTNAETGKVTKRETTIARKPGNYTEDAWQVMVIDTQEKRVYMYTFGAGMIQENMVKHVSDTVNYNTDDTKQKLARTNPIMIDPRNTGVYPLRRFGYGPKVDELGIKGIQET